jgi:hypothetical protein
VHIFSLVESDAPSAGAAVSVVLLLVSLMTLIAFDALRRWRFSGGS